MNSPGTRVGGFSQVSLKALHPGPCSLRTQSRVKNCWKSLNSAEDYAACKRITFYAWGAESKGGGGEERNLITVRLTSSCFNPPSPSHTSVASATSAVLQGAVWYRGRVLSMWRRRRNDELQNLNSAELNFYCNQHKFGSESIALCEIGGNVSGLLPTSCGFSMLLPARAKEKQRNKEPECDTPQRSSGQT